MPDTANNPQTPEEALAEYREVVAPVAFYDGCPLNDLKVENKTIRPPTMHLIIPKRLYTILTATGKTRSILLKTITCGIPKHRRVYCR